MPYNKADPVVLKVFVAVGMLYGASVKSRKVKNSVQL